MENKKEKLCWISMHPGSHFDSLNVKTDWACEKDQLTGIYAKVENKEDVDHICNLMKAFIKANYAKAKLWYEDLPKEYTQLIPKLKISKEKIMTEADLLIKLMAKHLADMF